MGGPERSGLLLQDGAEVESDGRRFVIMQVLKRMSMLNLTRMFREMSSFFTLSLGWFEPESSFSEHANLPEW